MQFPTRTNNNFTGKQDHGNGKRKNYIHAYKYVIGKNHDTDHVCRYSAYKRDLLAGFTIMQAIKALSKPL